MSLLSELCSICYVEKPKYRCPRCKIGTCSLPCYKRHQQRASCNGQRDPAEYLKKSQLATPLGIDRDYNYLKGVERDIENASRDTWDRGIGAKNASKAVAKGMHPESKLQQYFGRNRITMTRAPRGMSRQKTNQTRCTKRDHIMWTVEWIDSDGRSEVQHNCLEETTVEDVYAACLTEKANAESRRLNPEESVDKRGKKRKRQEQKQEGDAAEKEPKEGAQTSPAPETNEKTDEKTAEEVDPTSEEKPSRTEGKKPTPERFFYLLKTGTISANKVLIPLMPNCTLTESLQDQVVMEYPTYYVLPYSPGKLPPGLLTEHQYLKIRKGEEEELDEALIKAEKDGVLNDNSKVQTDAGATSDQVHANKILDMLKRDVTR